MFRPPTGPVFKIVAISRRLCCLFPFLCMPSLAHALSPDKSIGHFVTDSWRTGEGLPELAVEELLETSDGYLWVGTQEGLARFDGHHFTVFDHANTPELHTDYITMLAEDSQHALWIGSGSGLVVHRADGSFRSLTEKDGFHVAHVMCGTSDGDGSIWVGGVGGLAHIVSGRVVRSFDTNDGLASDLVTNAVVDREGLLWIIAQNRLHRLRDGKLERVSHADGISEGVTRILTSACGRLMVLANTSTVFRWSGDRFEAWWPEGVPRTERIRAIREDHDGTLWTATDTHGLFRTRTPTKGRELTEQAFNELRFELIYEDSAGNIWLGTLGRGLLRLHDGSFDTLTKNDGLAGDAALSVLVDRSGDTWVGTTSGLSQLSAGKIREFSTADGLASNYAASLASDHHGGLWIGMRGNTVGHLSDGKIDRKIVLKPPLVSNVVSAVLEDTQGRLWMGTTGGGLAQDTADGLRYFTHTDAQAENFINTVVEDSQADVWVGTNRGLWKIHEGKVDFDPLNSPAVSDWVISAIHEDAKHRLWIGTMARGLVRVEHRVITRYGREQGLPDDTINSILNDDNGDLWLGSNSGITRIPSDQIDEVSSGHRERFDAMQFGEADGMRIAETVSGSQPAAWHGADGRLWFVTGEGVAIVDPKHMQRDARPLRPLIESVRANDQVISFASADLRLPVDTSRLEIRYTAPNLIAAEAMHFRYRLSNYADTWSEVGNERVARYVNVPPGLHRFEVQARRAYEDWSTVDGAMVFYVTPTFYQTPWFFAALASIALAVLWCLHHLRVQWLRMESAVADERRRIAGEIHDSLAQGFSAISVQIEAALGRMQRAPELAVSHLRLARDVAGTSLAEARRSVWNLQSKPSSTSSLMTSLRTACEQIVFGYRTRLSVAASGKPWVANAFIEQNLVRIAQEAISNAVHHGESSEIQVEIVYRLMQLTLTITDDGCGFEMGKCRSDADRGFGLTSMVRRAENLFGQMDIQSAPGVGTQITVTVPRIGFLRRIPTTFRANGRRHGRA